MQLFFDLLDTGFLIFSILIFASFAGLFSERAGIINIAIEGQMTLAALIFSILGNILPNTPIYYLLAVIITLFLSMCFSLFHGFTCLKLKTNHLISGLAINALATGLTLFAIRAITEGSNFIQSKFGKLAIYHEGILSAINWYLIISLVIIVLVWIFFNKTSIGLRYTSSGENPSSLDAAGISVKKYRWSAMFLSGTFAGVAGIFFVPLIANFYYGNVQGFGFLALAVLIFGKWRVKSIVFSALLFALLISTSYYDLEVISFVPKSIRALSPYLISILTLVIFSKKPSVPRALGKPYDQSER